MPLEISREFLFVYGTLRRDAGHPMAGVLAGRSAAAVPATFQGRLYRVSWYPGAVPSAVPKDRVAGEVFVLNAESGADLLDQLDEYEEARPGPGGAALYRRERHPVRLADGREVVAWIYLYNGSTEGLERISSGDFLDASVPRPERPQRPQDSV